RKGPMIPILLLLAQVTAPAVDGAAFVKLDRNGWASVEAARPETLGAFERFWSWSQRCAPTRVETLDTAPPCVPMKGITIRAVRNGRPIAGALLAWGTRTLIEEVPDEILPHTVTGDDGTVHLPLPTAEPVYARIVGPHDAYDWRKLEVRGDSAELAVVAATEITINAVDERQQTATHVRALIST